ncbi:hypothetical protein [Paenibacillus rigui]|uniref:Uncharacterized protein n=1 Tax=Paenibacillus rigui TaxID=554312 RepID=A0A229UQW9_9BACL|nr:hypothetical protein [Paenibacillus rigui]OXM85814.1 hypothetical protein CF651_11290 [Paenibacillus rigui]
MNKAYKPLTSSIELHTAALNQTPVAVFIGKERIGAGLIEKITDTAVKIGDEYFFRANCAFVLEK